jgi:hypothetical protein
LEQSPWNCDKMMHYGTIPPETRHCQALSL